MTIQLVVKNFSTVITDAQLAAVLPAFQTQVTRDFAPVYGVHASLRIANKSDTLNPNEWLLGLYDDADQAGALGYHDVTNIGTPLGKVFAKTTIQDGGNWTVTFTHELLEMLADPWINLTAIDPVTNRLYAYEVCDACEADELGYAITTPSGTKVVVSDFVKPHFFVREASAVVHELYSFNGKLTKPFSLDAGGYLSYLDLSQPSAGWQQVTAKATTVKPVAVDGSGRGLDSFAQPIFQKHTGTSRGSRRRALFGKVALESSSAP